MAGENKQKLEVGIIETAFLTREESNETIDLEMLEEKTRNRTICRGWIRFSIERERNGGKNDVSNHENEKKSKHD